MSVFQVVSGVWSAQASLWSGLFCWFIMQMTHNVPIDPLNAMENSLQSIGRLTQTLLPGQAVRLFIAGEEEWGFIKPLCYII